MFKDKSPIHLITSSGIDNSKAII